MVTSDQKLDVTAESYSIVVIEATFTD